jgi:SulP family sulfate permease
LGYEGFCKLRATDMSIILGTMAIVVLWGAIQSVVSGVAITALLFIVNYSRVDVVKHAFSGATLQSHVERLPAHRRLFREEGEQIYILKLHGYIFFGTSNRLLDLIAARIGSQNKPPVRYVVLDFHEVSGMRTSAFHSFVKLRRLGRDKDFTILYAHIPPHLHSEFTRETFIDGDALVPDIHPPMPTGRSIMSSGMTV